MKLSGMENKDIESVLVSEGHNKDEIVPSLYSFFEAAHNDKLIKEIVDLKKSGISDDKLFKILKEKEELLILNDDLELLIEKTPDKNE